MTQLAAIKRWFDDLNFGTAGKSFPIHSAKLFTQPCAVLGRFVSRLAWKAQIYHPSLCPTTNDRTDKKWQYHKSITEHFKSPFITKANKRMHPDANPYYRPIN